MKAADRTGTDRTGTGAEERILTGVGVAPGIGVGVARVIDLDRTPAPEYRIAEAGRQAEIARLDKALAKAQRQLRRLKTRTGRMPPAAAEEMGYLLDAYIAMLDESRLVRGARRRIAEEGLNAEAAVQAEVGEIARGFEGLSDAYIAARAADVREVGDRVLRCLMNRAYHAFTDLPPDTVVIAEEITPADTAQMDPDRVAGFAAIMGGAAGHAAILARSLGLPAVLGVPGLIDSVRTGDAVIVDGLAGRVVIDPSPETLARYERRRAELERERRSLARLRDRPAVTSDGARVVLYANIEMPRDVDQALEAGAEGVGLYRTEFMFMNRETPPGEEEQYEALREVVSAMDGRPVTVRTLDIGGEKLAYSLGGHIADSVNPALGVRAIRLSLKEPRLFEAQLCAILRAAAHGPVRVLLPMIATAGEVRQVREILQRLWRRLKRRGVKLPEEAPPLGAMIEIPGAALAADSLAQVADFFAIGTNDLTMYTLAIDRADEQVAHLYNPLHPAVLRLTEFSIQAALRARIPVSVCGEIAGDPQFTPLLLGLGVRELSMAPAALPRVKQRIHRLDMTSAATRARMVMELSDSGRIAALLDDMSGLA